jgi:hypothetical protein
VVDVGSFEDGIIGMGGAFHRVARGWTRISN